MGQDRRLNVSIDPFLVSIIVALLWRVRVGYNSEQLIGTTQQFQCNSRIGDSDVPS